MSKKGGCLQRHRPAGRTIYFCADSAKCFLGFLLCDSHSAAIHLCAPGFIYTLQTFIKANLMGKEKGERVKKKSYKNAAATRGRRCLNKKTPSEKYLRIIYKCASGVMGKVVPENIQQILQSHTLWWDMA